MSHVGVGPRAVMRAVAFLTTGVLAVPALAGCTSEDPAGKPLAEQDVAAAARARISDGGTLRWAVDSVPDTLNAFQSDADATTTRVAQAVLPSMYRMDETGSPVRNPDYLESAEVVDTEPKQVVVYKLNQQAVWSDGREIGAADFAAQWRALSGKDSAYWTARNAGYDRIEKVERGANDLEVKVTFSRPYADWKALFTPLYPKDVTGTPDAFNDGARRALKVSAGPFAVKKVDTKGDQVVLTGNPRWWGEPAKLDEIVLRAVPRDERVSELVAGKLDLAEIDPETADEVTLAAGPRDPATGTPLMGPGGTPAAGPQGRSAAEALRSWAIANGSDEEAAEEEVLAREERGEAEAKARRRQQALSGFELRKSLEPAYTQLALNGAEGPLADERVRRAVARALDREELAEAVLKPLGLPAEPVGSHLALSGQPAYADGSGALGEQNAKEARALLADAGWVPGGPVKKKDGEEAAGAEKDENKDEDKKDEEKSEGGDDGTYIVGEDDKNKDGKNKDGKNDDGKNDDGGNDDAGDAKDGADRESGEKHSSGKNTAQGGAPGAYAPKGTAAPAGAAAAPLAKDGKELTLRFVLPSGPGSGTLRTVADRITDMLKEIGIGTRITKVPDESYFKDHIAAGEYDLALYSWPASAFPATDARPIYAKPVPAADGSLNVAQNYTRVGTDQVDQLFDRALATLDQKESRDLLRKADSRIWAAAGSVPLYQRPQLTAARKNLANAGAFGFGTPVYEDMGFLKKGAQGSRPTAPASPSPSS
ncbi:MULTISPECIES: ABC transporter family substrate-binding protein [Streptomyces]|uniref:ABC transporter family substrate-binding protein n=1 Tax=Streptomyces TaxID=1883 RepID=UPI0029AD0C10|nr:MULTISPECIES: ABC transporter family substrate-binding protein [unclassified Streptomyces]MDX3317819.1 ABC transporter family substrate-binding protein [Streptomyces sp. ME03-5684b]MDX3399925.1 ABC transporter family substrate-binding protein [Streptomyces sp. ME01-18h]WTE18746.1 ABC transporter family substrate-binding protein [Streptomyces anthocyanicus]